MPRSTVIHQNVLALHLERVKIRVQRHHRRFDVRLVDEGDRYSDDCVGALELKRIWGQGSPPRAQQFLDQLELPSLTALDDHLSQLDASRSPHHAGDLQGDDLLACLQRRFQLTSLEAELLLVAAAPRLDPDIARLYAFAWGDLSLKQPPASFLAELLTSDEASLNSILFLLREASTLVRYRLLELHHSERWRPSTPLLHATVAVPERVLSFLRGWDLGESAVAGCILRPYQPLSRPLVLNQKSRAALLDALQRRPLRVALIGPRGTGRRSSLQALSTSSVLEVSLFDALQGALRRGARLIERFAEVSREARLLNATLLLRLEGIEEGPMTEGLRAERQAFQTLIMNYPGDIAISAPGQSPLLSMLFAKIPSINFPLPRVEAQRQYWEALFAHHVTEAHAQALSHHLASRYQLTPGRTSEVIREVFEGRDGHDHPPLIGEVVEVIRRHLDHGLGWLADPYSVDLGLDDVVLPEPLRVMVDEILTYARQSEKIYLEWGLARHSPQGRGLSVLFSGPPGTGKTLLAGVLARELGRLVYRVDLSRVVSKYIGETEKNLAKIFDEASRAQAVLLFDEADSLFAKRTQVKSSHDRYANLETNFLLQRLEGYEGVSILTTNYSQSFDEAFQRRLRFHLEFTTPDEDARASLWQTLLPDGAPRSPDIDYEALGEAFDLSGGHIKNAVLRACVRAAHLDQSVDHDTLYAAGEQECREMGILVNVVGGDSVGF